MFPMTAAEVAAVRSELEAGGQIAHQERRSGIDGVEQPARRPSERERRAEEAIRADPWRSNKQITADLGLPANSHRPVEQARRRLEERGEIPRIDARVGSDGVVRQNPRQASARSGPERLMRRISRLLSSWDSERADPSSEIEELEALMGRLR